MRLHERLDFFWLGAGGLLAFFGADEIVAFRLSREPRWLGGNTALVGEIVAVLVGLLVMYGLGIREPLEESAVVAPPVSAPPVEEQDPSKIDDLGDPA